ncbi:zinc finger MYM-type protein 1-like [Amphiura filiformis]|uniref:zinc finger MYM-type protein 1-like n=1 Tax=Amphiura filiformis TaxID=82378 RepID=UPI003B219732
MQSSALTRILTTVLSKYAVKDKLIAQTYDGASTMKERINGVQAQMRQEYPYAHFVHCYAHQLNLIMEQACAKHNRQCKVFFANLSAFAVFFSSSTKRAAALDEYCPVRVPRAAPTRWNFNSRTVNTVYENRDALLKCLTAIRDGLPEDDHDDEQEEDEDNQEHIDYLRDAKTINEAAGLIKWLTGDSFLFLLQFFHTVMPHVDILYAILQKRKISVDEVNKQVETFMKEIRNMRSSIDSMSFDQNEDEPPSKRRRTDVESIKRACKEACDIMIVQAADRFSSVGNLVPLQLVDPNLFPSFAKEFPTEKLALVTELYPMVVKEKLRTELTVLYSRDEFQTAKSSLTLLQFLIENNLCHTFSEVCLLLEISLTTPLVSAESERCFSTLNRIKTFLRNTMTNDRLNALAALSIQKDMIRDMATFNQRVIDKFATSKNRRADFLYKTCARADDE